METIEESDTRKKGKTMVEQPQVLQLNTITLELQHFLSHIPNMAGVSFSVPASDGIYANLLDFTPVDSLGIGGQNLQVYLDKL